MEYRRLGNTGLEVSALGLGCNNFGMRCDEAQTQAVVDKALDLGVNFFDTADIYGGRGGSETLLGKALGARRKDVVIATKFAGPMGPAPLCQGGSKRYVHRAAEASLGRLGTDTIDLYQMHFPDAKTPIEETLDALDELVRQGKVRYIGCSNFAGWQLARAWHLATERGQSRFVSAQNHYNLLERKIRDELIPAATEYRTGVLPYFPLASGLLTGKYLRGVEPPAGTRLALWGERGAQQLSDANFDVVERLEGFASERGKALLDIALGWLLSQPVVSSVIAGATRPEQVESNARAAETRFEPLEMLAIEQRL